MALVSVAAFGCETTAKKLFSWAMGGWVEGSIRFGSIRFRFETPSLTKAAGQGRWLPKGHRESVMYDDGQAYEVDVELDLGCKCLLGLCICNMAELGKKMVEFVLIAPPFAWFDAGWRRSRRGARKKTIPYDSWWPILDPI